MATQVCIYAGDPALAQIRAQVLRKAGFEANVDCELGLEVSDDAAHDAGRIAVLCNSLDADAQVEVAQRLKAVAPEMKILILMPLGKMGSYTTEMGEVIPASPAELVAACARLAEN